MGIGVLVMHGIRVFDRFLLLSVCEILWGLEFLLIVIVIVVAQIVNKERRKITVKHFLLSVCKGVTNYLGLPTQSDS